MIGPQGTSCAEAPESRPIATGTVRMDSVLVNVSANRNSFHAPMNASRPVVTIAGHKSGRKTCVMMIQGVAPSTMAASSISTGRSRMKVVSTQTVKGSVKIV